MKTRLLYEGETCWTSSSFAGARILVDADEYYSSFCAAALRARSRICITGWQFDTMARLLRPDPTRPPEHPNELLPFLNYLCERTPELHVYITAWDYSLVYALEREWLQKLRFSFQSHSRVHFEFINHPDAGGCHHQKLVVIDGQLAFLGGLDLCDSRWDDRRHLARNPDRVDVKGLPYKPFHDIQAALTGDVVAPLERLFWDGWQRARGELPAVSEPAAAPSESSLSELIGGAGAPLRAEHIAISRTELGEAGETVVCEIEALFERAILAAERLIYVEVQYFTARTLADALCRRLSDPERRKLQVVLMMPVTADSPKEDLVLGNRQRLIRSRIAEMARHHGHQFRLLMSSGATPAEPLPATFIHSKLMIVDDEFLTLGSANFTNRSLKVDRELNVAWEARLEAPGAAEKLQGDIRALRASLLAEHAGLADLEPFYEIDGLVERLDEICARPDTKLRVQPLPAPDTDNPLLIAIFDPSRPLDWDTFDQALEEAFDSDEALAGRASR